MLLYAARAVRGFGDGFAVIILPAYLAEIGFDAFQIGIVATAALLGTAAATLLIGHLGARHDIRNLLLLGAAFMIASGILFPNAQHIVLVAMIAFFGTMNPSTGDLGMLVPLEHAMIARSVADQERTRRLRALQPDRRARDGGGRARGGGARSAGRVRHRQDHGAEAAVLRLCGAGRGHRARSTPACRMPR